MKTTKQKTKQGFLGNTGMTLVELLVALSLLMLVIFCFTPLFASYFKNIKTSGDIVSRDYTRVGLIERLLGNTGSNTGYEYEVSEIPLTMSVSDSGGNTYTMVSPTSEQDQSGYTQVIKGSNIVSTPNTVGGGFTTFYANSITANMVCFPSHISDDFKTKTITVYANGFRFNNLHNFKLQYTAEDGNIYDVNTNYYKFKLTKNSSIVELELNGDNDQINFRTSPLYIYYASYCIQIEVDAPTIVMVGEQASDGNYYYYVSSGELDEDGKMEIVAKQMNNPDYNQSGSQPVRLNAAMNDVEWVQANEGDGLNVSNEQKYGYYVMCGDNGQIRRFWKDSDGKYYWGGDNTVDYTYRNIYGDTSGTTQAGGNGYSASYGQTANSQYVFMADPNANSNSSHGNSRNGILIDGNTGLGKLYTNTAFTMNAVTDPAVQNRLKIWALNRNLVNTFETVNNQGSWYTGGTMDDVMYDRFVMNFRRAKYGNGLTTASAEGFGISGGSTELSASTNFASMLANFGSGFDDYFTISQVDVNQMESYDDFWEEKNQNFVTLTSVDAIRMNTTYSPSNANPTSSYMLYCGYIPAVLDLWSPTRGLDSTTERDGYTRWIATLGVAYTEDEALLLKNYPLIRSRKWTEGLINKREYHARLSANVWNYAASDDSSFSLSGIVGPANYASSESLQKALKLIAEEKANSAAYGIKNANHIYTVLPLNVDNAQTALQTQNTTTVSFGYLSNPRAMGNMRNDPNLYDITVDDYDDGDYPHTGVYVWTFDKGTTFLDIDSVTVEDNEGNEKNFSLAVGYTLSGLEKDFYGGVTVPTVMNCGVVYLRAGGAHNESIGSGYRLNQESNVFHQFYYTSNYWRTKNKQVGVDEKLLNHVVSAGYWRDIFHPLFYSTYGAAYSKEDSVTDPNSRQYSYVASHILMDKKLNCVRWGLTWETAPEAMWGASDGTLMDWYIDNEAIAGNGSDDSYNARSVKAEFQSYSNLEKAQEYEYTYIRWTNVFGTRYPVRFNSPRTLEECFIQATNPKSFQPDNDNVNGRVDADNAYLDRCSLELYAAAGSKYSPTKYGFISPLDTIEDVEYADDIWVAVGCQGQKYPTFCGSAAVTANSKSGSWVAVRSWEDQSGGRDTDPCRAQNSVAGVNNFYYLWHAVQISTIENCNIVQLTNTGGMWYAMGYIDENKNNACDEDEKAVMFYALDPTKACGGTENGEWDGGWRLATSSLSSSSTNYTQACHFDGNTWSTVNIGGINAMASRND